MDRHPVFSTALIARRCFTSKSASNEYHFGRPGIPVTLRELEEKTMRDVTSVDHFKHMAKVMAERMVSAVKGEFTSEAKAIQSDIEKLLKNVNNGPAALNNAVKNKRGNNKENNAASTTEEEKSSDEDSAPAPKATTKPEPKSRRGQKAKTESATTSEKPVEKPTRGGKKKAQEASKKEQPAAVAAAPAPPAKSKKEPAAKSTTTSNATAARGRRTTKRGQQAKESSAPNDVGEAKPEENAPAEAPAPVAEAPKVAAVPQPPVQNAKGGGRKRKNANALTPVNSNRGAKIQKTVVSPVVGAKIVGSPGSPTKIAIAGTNLVSLASLSQPLPPQVVLPTTPVAANQVQTIKSSAPPPQVIQLRPSDSFPGSLGGPTGSMQIRPMRAAGAPGTVGAPRPQFFKIVGGKPQQLTATGPGGTVKPPPGSRIVYMRPPGSNAVTSVAQVASSGTTPATAAVSTAGNKIILLSKQGQPIPLSKAGSSIVRIVSPNSLSSAGGKLTLAPTSPTKVTALRPQGSSTGPILLRTVAPRPVTSSAPPIQLPMAPLPKSALTTSSTDKKPVTSSAASEAAKAIQVLLPKNPLPPALAAAAAATSTAVAPSTVTTTLSSPQKMAGGATAKTTATTANGAFVWINSTRANFKLTSQINFASLDKFKNVSNKDVHFILAKIVTEDKSNDFTFKLNLQRESLEKSGKGSKKQKLESQESSPESYFLELEGKATVPTAQEWSLKVKTDPPVFLVQKGNFLSDFPAVRIPQDIAKKPFIDYELHIDKCSPMQVAANATQAANVVTSATTAPPPAKRGRKAAAAK